MKLKMWIGNFDGHREALVLAPNKERARKALDVGRADFDKYWVECNPTSLSPPLNSAALEAEVLYTRRYDAHPTTPWFKGRCA